MGHEQLEQQPSRICARQSVSLGIPDPQYIGSKNAQCFASAIQLRSWGRRHGLKFLNRTVTGGRPKFSAKEGCVNELVPVLMGASMGAAIWRYRSGRLRAAMSVLAVVISGAAATMVSGEYMQSSAYLLFDLGEAAAGLVIGFAIARLLQRRRKFPSSVRP
jgi:hypothetical protein